MSNHTPGPWRVCGGFTPAYIAVHSDAGYIVFGMADRAAHHEGVQRAPIKAPSTDTQRANARLIAAAPEMLEALKAIQEWILTTRVIENPNNTLNEAFVKANNLAVAAIAKAEGR